MKSVFILANEKNIVSNLANEMKKYSSALELAGAGELNEENKQNCSFFQPDYIVTGNISPSEAKELLDLCISTNIIIVSNDMNRANNVIDKFQKEGEYRITAVDLNVVSPTALCESIINYKDEFEEESVDDIFGNSVSEADLLASEESKVELEGTVDYDKIEAEKLALEKKELLENPNDLNNHIEIQTPVTSFNLNINNIKSKTITVFSKKGGVGKTNIAKEMCNVFSSVKLPKKLQNGNEYLRACIVDLDFNKGNLRTYLGISNPTPNIYYWINDILDRIENKTPIEKISFNQLQVNGYVKKVEGANNFYSLVTAQGGLPVRAMKRIYELDTDGVLLSKILNIIIDSLRKSFDVVILDCGSELNDVSSLALEKADNIIYVINPTVVDIENLKVFTDEIALMETVDLNKVGIVINKLSKRITFKNEMLDVLSLIKYKDIDYVTGDVIEKNFPLIADVPYDETVINLNNGYLFTTNNAGQETKRGILKICEFVLPIFKIKYTTSGLKEMQRQYEHKKKLEQKKKKRKVVQEKTKVSKQNKKTKVADKKSKVVQEKTKIEKVSATPKNFTDESKLALNEYLNGDLKNVTLEEFEKTLLSHSCLKLTKTGYPILNKKPKTLSKTVWKKYSKNLEKHRKESYKLKKQESKQKTKTV